MKVADTQVIVIAAGRTPAELNNNRGRQLEHFIALLLADLGYTKPTKSSMNVVSAGIELDVVATNLVTNQKIIVECKAYTNTIPASYVNQFFGKLMVQRFSDPDAFGMFVGIPRLAPQGAEQCRVITRSDHNFRYYGAVEIAELVQERKHASLIEARPGELLTDHAIIVSEHGILTAAKRIDPTTRQPTTVLLHCNVSTQPRHLPAFPTPN